MKLGIGSYTYTWAIGVPGSEPEEPMTAVGLVERAAELGVRLVQICDNLPLDRLSPDCLGALGRRARELGVEIEVGTRGIEPEHLKTYLDLAERLGSKLVRVVIDKGEHKPEEDEVVSLIRPIMAELERRGVALAIENHDRFRAATFAAIIDRIGSPSVGICLDTVNSFGALEGPEVVVDALARYTVSLHVKDFTIRRVGHQMGFVIEGAPAGQGRLDIPWLLDQIRTAGRDPNAITELWTPPEPDLAATIAKEDTWARQSVGHMRKVLGEPVHG
jgi:sugar phosphate isomerase/epimerase